MLSDYLSKNGISNMEELIGREVFLILPRQGIKNYAIRRIQYGKQHKWMMCLPENYRVSELGEEYFLYKGRSRKISATQLDKYSNEQRERIVKQKIEERNKELKDLNRLLTKYPDEESRKEVCLCKICKHDVSDYKYWLCENCNNCNNFKCDIDKVIKLFGEE